jgi:hypothetical protein
MLDVTLVAMIALPAMITIPIVRLSDAGERQDDGTHEGGSDRKLADIAHGRKPPLT